MSPGPEPCRAPGRLVPVQEGALRVAPLLGVPPLLVQAGLDPGAVMVEAGIDPALFADPDNAMAFTDAGRFLAHCAARTGWPHFGLLACRHIGLEALGLVGQLGAQCPDIGSALRNIVLYLHLHDRGAIPSLWVSGDRAILGYAVHQPDVPGVEHIYDGALVVASNIMQRLAGPGWGAAEVRLCRPRPADAEPYRRIFRTPVRFDAGYSALVFSAAWLDRPLGGANPLVHRRIMQEIEALEARGSGDLAAQLQRVLRRLLIGGAGPGATSMDQIAQLFAIHRRTLNRRLRAQGTSFRALVDAARYDIARQLLRDTRLPIADVASALDYADAAAFTRAFRRWSGASPTAWRSALTAG